MAWRIGEYITYGELNNTRNYSTSGVLMLRGPGAEGTVIHLQLTGNCESDIKGKHIRFSPGSGSLPIELFPADQAADLAIMQVGPTGTMRTQGWIRSFSCSTKEFVHRAKLGEPPPTKWTRLVYLEWYSQNGRVVVEMPGAIVEECVRPPTGDDDDGEWTELPNLALPPEFAVGGPPPDLPSITLVEQGSHRELDPETMEILPLQDNDTRIMGDLKLFDECRAQHEEEFILDIAPGLENLPADDVFTDEGMEAKLKDLLMRLAMIGIALDVCEHYTPRECYRYLRDDILPDQKIFRRMIGTGFIQHFCTWEKCLQCNAELNEKYGPKDSND